MGRFCCRPQEADCCTMWICCMGAIVMAIPIVVLLMMIRQTETGCCFTCVLQSGCGGHGTHPGSGSGLVGGESDDW